MTIKVIRLLLETGRIKRILFNDPEVQKAFPGTVKPCCKIPGTNPIQYDRSHDDHLHIDFNPTQPVTPISSPKQPNTPHSLPHPSLPRTLR
jgi:hypothetical protein